RRGALGDGRRGRSPPHVRLRPRAVAELLPVAHLGCADAESLLRLPRSVGGPAAALVEAARARVLLEDPEQRDVVLRGELGLRGLDQRAPRAGRPGLRLDVDRVQLAQAVLVAA